MHAQLSSGFDGILNLHPYFVYASSKGSWPDCMDLRVHTRGWISW